MANKLKKYIGWGIAYEKDGQKAITIVSAKTKAKAIEKLELLGLEVFEKEQIRHVCVVLCPGPNEVLRMEKQDWNECIKYTEWNQHG